MHHSQAPVSVCPLCQFCAVSFSISYVPGTRYRTYLAVLLLTVHRKRYCCCGASHAARERHMRKQRLRDKRGEDDSAESQVHHRTRTHSAVQVEIKQAAGLLRRSSHRNMIGVIMKLEGIFEKIDQPRLLLRFGTSGPAGNSSATPSSSGHMRVIP